MKTIYTALFFSVLAINASAQYPSQNITLLSNWDSAQVPQEPTYYIRYNGIWGWHNTVDNKEYAIIGSSEGVHFVEVTNPANPRQRDFVPGRRNQTIWREIKTYQNYCYMVSDDGAPNSLQIVDMSYLPDSVYVVYDSNTMVERAHAIFIDGNKMYLGIPKGNSVGGTSQLAVYSLANPQIPQFLKKIETDIPSGLDFCHDMFVRNDTVYASMSFTGLFIFKFSNNTFTQIGSLTSYQNQGYNHSSALTKDGKTLIFCDEVPAGLPIKSLNVQNMNNLTVLSNFRSTTNSTATAHNAFIRKNDNTHVIVGYYQDGVQIFDITNPANPVRTGYIDTNPNNCPTCPNPNYSGCWGAYVDLPSGIILASDMQNGLFVLDATGALVVNGIENSSLVTAITFFPNPANESAFINIAAKTTTTLQVQLTDVTGKIISTQTNIINAGANQLALNVATLSGGIYFVNVIGTDFSVTQKLVKE
jgi:choice-of-anchor B domain-containing protein